MPSSDYSNAVGGGLKLKGAKDAGVKKHKKSKKAKAVDGESTEKSSEQTALQVALADEERLDGENGTAREIRETEVKEYGKTEAQKRQEERRRKRLEERLTREGIKTHKERVEELNKYLSNLSEHHDMPRIGPG
ncbi:hypothetical protein B0A50_08149 [Salinomyces thailandicus]|uniref:DUF1754-domain-containing protein n=1 Tax=Salinomyces thailandicus TaxID=706561 RepID=A0A4V5N385_9PEZI|nr:hypothetical protein B0A50_08149 [Salinomyces thailandica]